MKYKFCSVIFITTFFFLILVNNNSFAAPDAGSLLKQEKESYKSYKDPLLKPKNNPKKERQKQESSDANKIYVKSFRFRGEINNFDPQVFKNLLRNFTNKKNTFEDLEYAASLIQNLYLENG